MKFVIHRGDAGFWFTIVGRNGKTLATSETYRRRSGVGKTINVIARGAPAALIVEAASVRARP